MGQGTDSCGGWDLEHDPYEEGLATGMWTTRGGGEVSVDSMTLNHLKGARYVAMNAARNATFSSDTENFEEWVDIFDEAIADKERKAVTAKPGTPAATPKAPQPSRGAKTTMVCHCGEEYQARTADIKRGWAKSCSKRCAAIRRDYGRPAAKAKKAAGGDKK